MPLHHEARALLELMAQSGAPGVETQTPAEAQAARAELAPPVTERCHGTEDVDGGGVPARLAPTATAEAIAAALAPAAPSSSGPTVAS